MKLQRFAKSFISVMPLLVLGVVAWLLLRGAGKEELSAGKPEAPVKPPPPLTEKTQKKAPVISEEEWERYQPMRYDSVFVMPVGDRGLEFTEEFKNAKGSRASFSGYMVRHPHADHQMFLITPSPMTLNMAEYGLADDLPPWAVHVILPEKEKCAPAWQAGAVTVCGILEQGPRQEADGRVSHFRLIAEHVVAEDTREILDLMKPVVFQAERMAATAASERANDMTGGAGGTSR